MSEAQRIAQNLTRCAETTHEQKPTLFSFSADEESEKCWDGPFPVVSTRRLQMKQLGDMCLFDFNFSTTKYVCAETLRVARIRPCLNTLLSEERRLATLFIAPLASTLAAVIATKSDTIWFQLMSKADGGKKNVLAAVLHPQ